MGANVFRRRGRLSHGGEDFSADTHSPGGECVSVGGEKHIHPPANVYRYRVSGGRMCIDTESPGGDFHGERMCFGTPAFNILMLIPLEEYEMIGPS